METDKRISAWSKLKDPLGDPILRAFMSKKTPLMRFCMLTRSITAWVDCDGLSFLVRWWHPLTWILVPVSVLLAFAFGGVRVFLEEDGLSDLGITMSKYWRQNRDDRIFVTYRDMVDARAFWEQYWHKIDREQDIGVVP